MAATLSATPSVCPPVNKKAWGWGSPVIHCGTVFGCFRYPQGGEKSVYGGVDLLTGKVVLAEDCLANRNHLHAAHGVVWNGGVPYAQFDGKKWHRADWRDELPCINYTTPVVAGGRMYTRSDDGHVHCFDLR